MGPLRNRLAGLALAGAAVAGAPAAADSGEYGWGDLGRHDVVVYSSWRGDFGTRSHRTALEDGYFGQGARNDGRGGYDYDRGYPYDYYSEDGREEAYEDIEMEPRETRCDTEWAHDGERREKVPVTVCRG